MRRREISGSRNPGMCWMPYSRHKDRFQGEIRDLERLLQMQRTGITLGICPAIVIEPVTLKNAHILESRPKK